MSSYADASRNRLRDDRKPWSVSGTRDQRFNQKLVSAWNQGNQDDADSAGEADDALIGAAAKPKKRARARLTETKVDGM